MVTTSGSFSGVGSTQKAQAFHIEPPQEEVAFPGSGTSQLLEVLPTRVVAQQKKISSGIALAAIQSQWPTLVQPNNIWTLQILIHPAL